MTGNKSVFADTPKLCKVNSTPPLKKREKRSQIVELVFEKEKFNNNYPPFSELTFFFNIPIYVHTCTSKVYFGIFVWTLWPIPAVYSLFLLPDKFWYNFKVLISFQAVGIG